MTSCFCSRDRDKKLTTSLPPATLLLPVTSLGNWDEIQEEMMMSNVLQRDNVIFARKLDPLLETSARLNDQKAKSEKLWTAVARREVVEAVLVDWLELCRENQEEHSDT